MLFVAGCDVLPNPVADREADAPDRPGARAADLGKASVASPCPYGDSASRNSNTPCREEHEGEPAETNLLR